MYTKWLFTKDVKLVIDNAPNPDILVTGKATNFFDNARFIEIDHSMIYNLDYVKRIEVVV